jgi:8-oxo-(d)GTP phosphatase
MAAMRLIRSAGGVLWRRVSQESVEVAVVGRDRYGDWTLPKGKVKTGEPVLAAAVREVWEETATRGIPQVRLPSVRYLTGEPETEKAVDFWGMQAVEESPFTAGDEVSELRWLDPEAALATLTYAHDRGVLSAFSALKPVTGLCVLVRHAHAGSRSHWTGPDHARPLDEKGEAQMAVLAPLLKVFKPNRVYAAPVTRCVDCVSPIGLVVRTDSVFAESRGAAPKAVAERIRELVAESGRVVVCSQGGVIPKAVEALRPPNATAGATFSTPKGAAWVLSFSGPDLVAADPLPIDDTPVDQHEQFEIP